MITKPFTLHVSREGLGESVAVCIVLPHRSAALAVRQIAYEDCLQAAASARDLESAIRRHRLLPDLKSIHTHPLPALSRSGKVYTACDTSVCTHRHVHDDTQT